MEKGTISFLQTKLNERTYLLLCDPLSPISEIRDALKQFDDEAHKIELEHSQKVAEQAALQPEAQVTEPAMEQECPQ